MQEKSQSTNVRKDCYISQFRDSQWKITRLRLYFSLNNMKYMRLILRCDIRYLMRIDEIAGSYNLLSTIVGYYRLKAIPLFAFFSNGLIYLAYKID